MTDEKGKAIRKKAFKSLCIIEFCGIVITTKKRLYMFMDFMATMNAVDSFINELGTVFKELMKPQKKQKRKSTARKPKKTNTGKKRVPKPKSKNKKK